MPSPIARLGSTKQNLREVRYFLAGARGLAAQAPQQRGCCRGDRVLRLFELARRATNKLGGDLGHQAAEAHRTESIRRATGRHYVD